MIAQTFADWRCFIVDDASTDSTLAILEEYASSYPDKFNIIHQKENKGCGLTRRHAIEEALKEKDWDWASFIDSDDYVDSCFLQGMIGACQTHGAEIAICGTVNHCFQYQELGRDVSPECYEVSGEELYKQYMLSAWVKQYNGNKVYARRIIEKVEYSHLRYCEDSMTTYKWLWEANKAVVLPEAFYHYVRHDDSNSNKGNEPLRKAIDTCVCVHDHFIFCKEHGFSYMYERLRNFISPHLFSAIARLGTDDPEYAVADHIRNAMF